MTCIPFPWTGKISRFAANAGREHSPFVTIIIVVATGWLFEDGYAKEAARYFQTA